MSITLDTQKELAHLARALKAPRLLAAAERLAPIARESNWSHEQYLAAVLSQEVSSREASGSLLRVKAAGFDSLKTLEDFNYDFQPAAPRDVIARDFTSSIPGTRLVGDITYLRTGEGWLYLATVIDLATRMVVGWCTDDNMRTPLIEKALEMARLNGHVKPQAVFHSGRGNQYASSGFSTYCTTIDVTRSVGKTGVCWDNSVAESFFATLKNEMYYRYRFTSRARARFAVAKYIEVFYNRKRAHSSIGYLTPSEKLQEFQATPMAA